MNIELIQRRARRTDPHTSHAAAQRSARFAGSHAARILAVFQATPGYTYTADELAGVTGLSIVQICRRLPELSEIEVVRVGGMDLERDGYRVWRLQAPCYFTEAGERDRLALDAAKS